MDEKQYKEASRDLQIIVPSLVLETGLFGSSEPFTHRLSLTIP
jgi:hypothetical protein